MRKNKHFAGKINAKNILVAHNGHEFRSENRYYDFKCEYLDAPDATGDGGPIVDSCIERRIEVR